MADSVSECDSPATRSFPSSKLALRGDRSRHWSVSSMDGSSWWRQNRVTTIARFTSKPSLRWNPCWNKHNIVSIGPCTFEASTNGNRSWDLNFLTVPICLYPFPLLVLPLHIHYPLTLHHILAMNSILCPALVVHQYEGSTDEEGSYHGKGMLLLKSGCVYEGDFVHGRIEGQGCFQWQDGTQYEGTFQDNDIDGTGTYHWYEEVF